ncbi:hypothetical protein AVEN_795-1 [Araneus ventricosus]|uniref:Integrase catalytic domain-containing protein n=1 Tax=Araneus ventricosus TaxID=182803 RepID=A0A4Y2MQX8_ARAVE|nr:hypothetical protein AVEN_795-1 [Araneus ventricosus]
MAYTPQQNGVAERMNRTLVEEARTMLYEADLEKYLWGQAIFSATYIRNRCPTTAVKNQTPAEKWYRTVTRCTNIEMLNAEQYIEDCPRSLGEAKSRPDYKYWKKAVDDEMASFQKNET